ncbi:MAG TPA: BRO family protein [Pilimelia sp.]|nr:BRO family protein [Pilimelia sp.]
MTHPGGGAGGTGPGGGAGTGPGRELQTFTFGDLPMRTVVVGGEPWFVAADVARLLGYRDAHNLTRRLDADDRGTRSVSTPSGQQEMTVISEAGLYAAILGSQVPGARAFKQWVTRDVLPTIRRTGRYEVAPAAPAIPQSYAEALQLAADQAREIERQAAALAEAEPKAEAWEVLASAHGDYSVREAAFMLNRDPAISTGQNRLFALLRDWKLIDRHGIPYAAHERHVRLRARHFTRPSGVEETAQQVRITAEGLRYLHRRMGGTHPHRVFEQAALPGTVTERKSA